MDDDAKALARKSRRQWYEYAMAAAIERAEWRAAWLHITAAGTRSSGELAMRNWAAGILRGLLRGYELAPPRVWTLSPEAFEWFDDAAVGKLDNRGGKL